MDTFKRLAAQLAKTLMQERKILSYLDSVECVVLLVHEVARLSGVNNPVWGDNAEHVPCSEHCLEVLQPLTTGKSMEN